MKCIRRICHHLTPYVIESLWTAAWFSGSAPVAVVTDPASGAIQSRRSRLRKFDLDEPRSSLSTRLLVAGGVQGDLATDYAYPRWEKD